MSLDRFRSYLSQLPEVKYPNVEWSIRWIKRIFEFFKEPFDSNLTFDTNQLIAFLVAMKKNGVPAWQRHQAAMTAGRYQMMSCGTIEPGFTKSSQSLPTSPSRNAMVTPPLRIARLTSLKTSLPLSLKLARHCGEDDTSSTLKSLRWLDSTLSARQPRERY